MWSFQLQTELFFFFFLPEAQTSAQIVEFVEAEFWASDPLLCLWEEASSFDLQIDPVVNAKLEEKSAKKKWANKKDQQDLSLKVS